MNKTDDADAKELARVLIAIKHFATACEEIKHYLDEGNDYFSISVGPWQITYSEIEEEQNENRKVNS